MNRRLSSTAYGVAAAFVVATSATASAGLYSILQQWNFIVPAAIGALGAAAVSVASRWKSLLLSETIALTTVAFVVVGILIAGNGIPDGDALRDFFGGLTSGWAELLAGTPPTDLNPELRVVPFTLTWVGTVIGLEVLRRIPQPALPVLGPIATFAVTTLLTDEDRTIALTVGAVLIVGALAIGIVQQRALRSVAADELDSPMARNRRMATTAAMVALVAVVAPWLGPRLPLAEANERYDLRDEVVPPWNPLALPSPLTQIKPTLDTEETKDVERPVMFTVESGDKPLRFATAVMGAYDGRVWNVGSGLGPAPTEFRPVDSRLPEPPDEIGGDSSVEATVTIGELTGPWVPTPGWPQTFTLTSLPSGAPPDDVVVRENVNTGTLAIPNGLAAGATYRIAAQPTPELTDDQLAELTMRPLSSDVALEVLPPTIRDLAGDYTEGEHGWGAMAKIRDALKNGGFYVADDQAPPGHSYGRIEAFLADPDRIFGYEEQYAATAALMGRIFELPTRVVVGYEITADRYVDDTAEVRENDLTAWVEARVDGVGWVPVDVTPEQVLEPDQQQQQTVPQEVPTPNDQPPPPPPPQLDVVPDNEEEEEEPEEEEEDEFEPVVHGFSGPSARPYAIAGGAGSAGLILLFVAAVVGFKAYRRRRRRRARQPAYRIAGAWHELADRYHEAGVPTPKRATPLETATAYLSTEPSAHEVRPDLLGLVTVVDRAAWHHDPPPGEQADEAWGYCDGVLSALAHDRSWLQRTKMKLDPRPLWRRDVWLKAQRPTAAPGDPE